ncbi:hypothetical protein EDC04DRAFT_1070728 [Pisolithus marmoratus]|nr:hypothetical protein EDC04DRAFT_1070728 [Pisolithus marmoratus]
MYKVYLSNQIYPAMIANPLSSWFVSLLSLLTCLLWSPCTINQVQPIQQSLYFLRMPTLSNSMENSLQYTAEHGIGAILVLEYLYFLLQIKDQRNDLESVHKIINEAFQDHGENVEILCLILLQVAKEKQMSRTMNRKR